MAGMKHTLSRAALALALAGCGSLQQSAAPILPHGAARPSAPHSPSKGELLLAEANRLAEQVKSGALGRAAAADQLNRYRLKVVGANPVDDSNFAVYRKLAAARDAGQIDQETSQAQMEAQLRDWLRRWPRLNPKPAEPVFSNFLLHLYGLPPLGY